MDRQFIGWDSDYENNYNKIFKKPLLIRMKEWIDRLLYNLFIK